MLHARRSHVDLTASLREYLSRASTSCRRVHPESHLGRRNRLPPNTQQLAIANGSQLLGRSALGAWIPCSGEPARHLALEGSGDLGQL